MIDEPRPYVSEVSEITDGGQALAFVAAVGWGTLAGSLAFGLPLIVGESNAAPFILVSALLAAMIIGFCTVAGLALVGLPLTGLLKLAGFEFAALYALSGLLGGLFVTSVVFDIDGFADALTSAILCSGTAAGLASGFRWGRWREAVARRGRDDAASTEAPANPIHELLH